ncbi:hypothetical protein [Fictibacillus norfolkensis]|jgi:hypothetical protein|uniref:Uncharacterized protein n=1 Tax=Fictibacillus norfolkensis TaxID=2762233 RepID=A0ABR8SNQ8_9BACL|nr:hypothetical protein [Fictibacillus norfolkensis]MBD7965096.1 hypothetical protein [Fictibacillus norfolkensis]
MKKKLAAIVGVMSIAAAVSVSAGTTYSSYSTTVGAFNGDGYTSYSQTKTTSGANGYVKSSTVGGNYVVDVRMQDAQGNSGDWARNLGDGDGLVLDGHINHIKGDAMRLHFSNDFDTSVNVQVSGSWKSN